MKRKNFILILSIACLLLFSAAAVALLLKSEGASRYLIDRLSRSTNNALAIEKTEGDLLTGLKIHGIDYHVNQNHISIEQVKLDISPLKLLAGKLHFKSVHMAGIALMLADYDENSSDLLPNNSLPFKVTADDVRLNKVVLRHGDQEYDIEQIHLKASVDKNVLQIERFECKENDIHISVEGNAKFIEPYLYQATIRWVKLFEDKEIRGKCDIQGDINTLKFHHQFFEPHNIGIGGEVSVNRMSPDLYQIVFIGDLNGENIPPTDIQVSGQGSLQDFVLRKFTAKSLGGEINAVGHISWQPSPRWDLIIDGVDIDPGENWSLWPGKLGFEAKVSGEVAEGVPMLELEEIAVGGYLLDQPFHASGDMLLNNKNMTIKNLSIRSGNNHLALDGIASMSSNLRFEFDVPETENLWPGIYGHVRGNGSLKGEFRNPVGTITFNGTDMRYGGYNLQKIESAIQIDLKKSSQSKGQVKLHELRVSDKYFSDLSLNWNGDFEANRAHMNIISPTTSMELQFNGSSVKDNCELNIDAASFDLEKYGRWQLLNPTKLQIGPYEIKPFDTCWVQDKSEICLRSSWKDTNGWKAQGDTDAPALVAILEILEDITNRKHLGWDKTTGN